MKYFSVKKNPLILTAFIGALLAFLIYKADVDEMFWTTTLEIIPHYDKIGHFVLFGLFALFLNKGLNYHSLRIFGKLSIRSAALIVLAFCTVEEYSQQMFESRTFDYRDLLSDVVGVLFFTYLYDFRIFCHQLYESRFSRLLKFSRVRKSQ